MSHSALVVVLIQHAVIAGIAVSLSYSLTLFLSLYDTLHLSAILKLG